MNALTLRGRDLADGGRGVEVTLREGLIASIDVTDEVGPDEPWIGPGLVDLQVNGYGEGDANAAEPHPEQIHAMCRSLAQRGVSQFLPTVITASPEAIVQRIAVIAEASRAAASMGMVAGIHVEGPFLSPEDGPRGVHPLEHVRPPSISEIGGWLEAGRGMVRIVTLSPHHSGTEAAIDFLVSNDVRVAIGHTHANDQQIASAVDAGATLSTHLGNGAHSMLPRHPNYLWSQLAESRLAAGLIADGHHLPDSTLAAMLAAKRRHGAFLVSDSVATPPDLVTDGHSTVGGRVSVAPDGALRHVETGFLAGSIQALDVGVATVARLTGSLREAVMLASEVPARIVGGRDAWCVGARADVLRFHWQPGDTAIRPVSLHIQGQPVLDRRQRPR